MAGFCVAFAIGIYGHYKLNPEKDPDVKEDRFSEGVTINGIAVGGKTASQVYEKLYSNLSHRDIELKETPTSPATTYVIKHAGLQYYQLDRASIDDMIKENHNTKKLTKVFSLPVNKKNFATFIKNEILSQDMNGSRNDGKMSEIIKTENGFTVTGEAPSNKLDIDRLINKIASKPVSDNQDTNTYYLSDYYYGFDKNYLGLKALLQKSKLYNELLVPINIKSVSTTSPQVISNAEILSMFTLNNNELFVNKSEVVKWVDNHYKPNTEVDKVDLVNQITKQLTASQRTEITPNTINKSTQTEKPKKEEHDLERS